MSAIPEDEWQERMEAREANLKTIASLVPPVEFRGLKRFYDIGPLLKNWSMLMTSMEILAERVKRFHPTTIAGVDARGFIFGPLIASHLALPFVMIRKQGKMPNEAAVSKGYDKEYKEVRQDRLAMQHGSIGAGDRVAVVDDIIATGGTLVACEQVIKAMGAEVAAHCCIVYLDQLGAARRLNAPIVDLVSEQKIAEATGQAETETEAETSAQEEEETGEGEETGEESAGPQEAETASTEADTVAHDGTEADT